MFIAFIFHILTIVFIHPEIVNKKKAAFQGSSFRKTRKITQTKKVCYIVAKILDGWQSIRVNSYKNRASAVRVQ